MAKVPILQRFYGVSNFVRAFLRRIVVYPFTYEVKFNINIILHKLNIAKTILVVLRPF